MDTTVLNFESFLLNDCYTVNYYVANADILVAGTGDNRTKKEVATMRKDFLQMVDKLENIFPFSYGTKATRLWLRSYTSANWFFGEDDKSFWSAQSVESNVNENRLNTNIEPYWIQFAHNGNNVTATNFWFTIAYHNMSDIVDLRQLQLARRAIVNEYPQFKIYGYHEYDVVCDSMYFIPIQLSQMTGTHFQPVNPQHLRPFRRCNIINGLYHIPVRTRRGRLDMGCTFAVLHLFGRNRWVSACRGMGILISHSSKMLIQPTYNCSACTGTAAPWSACC
jgi:hypothetical protein